jgi:putative flippase GtrA
LAHEKVPRTHLRRWISFGTIGLIALAIDASILTVLTSRTGLSPFLARVPAILVAMVFGWLGNRTITFGLRSKPNLAEFLRYAAASGLGICVNYAAFAAQLLLIPGAMALASVVAAGVSYLGYHRFAFAGKKPLDQ